jgi:hypothetical protein
VTLRLARGALLMLPFRAADEPLPERALLPAQLLLLPSGQGSSPRQLQLLPRQLDDFGRLKAQPDSKLKEN